MELAAAGFSEAKIVTGIRKVSSEFMEGRFVTGCQSGCNPSPSNPIFSEMTSR